MTRYQLLATVSLHRTLGELRPLYTKPGLATCSLSSLRRDKVHWGGKGRTSHLSQTPNLGSSQEAHSQASSPFQS